MWGVGGLWRGQEKIGGGLDAADPKSPHWRTAEPGRPRSEQGSGRMRETCGMGEDGVRTESEEGEQG